MKSHDRPPESEPKPSALGSLIAEVTQPEARVKEAMKAMQGRADTLRASLEWKREARKRVQERIQAKMDFGEEIGRMSYGQLMGKSEKKIREGVLNRFPEKESYRYATLPISGNYAMPFGATGHSADLGRPIKKPADYIALFDQQKQFTEERVDGPEYPGEMNAQEFFDRYGETSLRVDEQGVAVRVKDVPKEVAQRVYAWTTGVSGGGLPARVSWQMYQDGIELTLKGFSEAALEAGDLDTALEGYRRLGLLEDPHFVATAREQLLTLRASTKPEDQKKFQVLVAKFQKAQEALSTKE